MAGRVETFAGCSRTALDTRELISLGSTDATKPVVVGNDVYDPLTFQPEIVRFSRKQYLFLNAYRLGIPLADAAAKAGMPVESAQRFLEKPDTVRWLQDRALQHHIKTEWEEPAKWWAMGNEVLEGRKEFNKSQSEIWKEFGRRVAPVIGDAHAAGPRIEINIDPTAVQEAFRRQQAIEAEIVKDAHVA